MNWERHGFTYNKTAKVKSEVPSINSVPDTLMEMEMAPNDEAVIRNPQIPEGKESEVRGSANKSRALASRKQYKRYSRIKPE